jgi:hypothetical protein
VNPWLDGTARITSANGPSRHVLRHDGSGADDSTIRYDDSWKQDRLGANEHLATNVDVADCERQ